MGTTHVGAGSGHRAGFAGLNLSEENQVAQPRASSDDVKQERATEPLDAISV
jgi:hypothetical protein